MAWHWCLAWATKSLYPDSFLPEGEIVFGCLGLRALSRSVLLAFSYFPSLWFLLIAGSGPYWG